MQLWGREWITFFLKMYYSFKPKVSSFSWSETWKLAPMQHHAILELWVQEVSSVPRADSFHRAAEASAKVKVMSIPLDKCFINDFFVIHISDSLQHVLAVEGGGGMRGEVGLHKTCDSCSPHTVLYSTVLQRQNNSAAYRFHRLFQKHNLFCA